MYDGSLQKVAGSLCHSLRTCWWSYHIFVVLVGGEIMKLKVAYIDFGKAIEEV